MLRLSEIKMIMLHENGKKKIVIEVTTGGEGKERANW